MAGNINDNYQSESYCVKKIRSAEPDFNIGYRDENHQGKKNTKEAELSYKPRSEAATTCGVKHQKPDEGKDDD